MSKAYRRPPTGDKNQPLFANDFFIPLPAEFFSDLENGKLTPSMFTTLCVIWRQVDFETGIWLGCGLRIHASTNGRTPLRTAQDNLKSLRDKGYVVSFHESGERGNFPHLVHNYPIRFGERRGCRLNAKASASPEAPVYEKDAATTTQPPRNDRADTAQEARNDRAKNPLESARIPEVQTFPDSDFPEQENQTIQTTQNEPAWMGWLVTRAKELISAKTNKVTTVKKTDREQLLALTGGTPEGSLRVLLGLYLFSQRSLSGLAWPLVVFIKEAREDWLPAADRSVAENNDDEDVVAVMRSYDAPQASPSGLYELAYQHMMVNDRPAGFDFVNVVREFMNAHYPRVNAAQAITAAPVAAIQ